MPLGGSVVSVAELWLRQTALFSVACALTFLQTEALILSSEKNMLFYLIVLNMLPCFTFVIKDLTQKRDRMLKNTYDRFTFNYDI